MLERLPVESVDAVDCRPDPDETVPVLENRGGLRLDIGDDVELKVRLSGWDFETQYEREAPYEGAQWFGEVYLHSFS